MPLTDLLKTLTAEAGAELSRLSADTDTAVAAVLDSAREQAVALRTSLASEPTAAGARDAARLPALARLAAADELRTEREDAFGSVLDGVRAELAELRSSARYPGLFASLLAEARAALPAASVLRVDPRDRDLAQTLAGDLRRSPVLLTWGGVELDGDDGRVVRNTIEERLTNAEPTLRLRFAHSLALHEQRLVLAVVGS